MELRTPDEVLTNYVEDCRQSDKTPSLAEAGMLLNKALGMRAMQAIGHIKAYALERPGSFPNVRVSSPRATLVWIFIDFALMSWMLWSAWRDYREGNSIWLLWLVFAMYF